MASTRNNPRKPELRGEIETVIEYRQYFGHRLRGIVNVEGSQAENIFT
jgi:hypothetical protein